MKKLYTILLVFYCASPAFAQQDPIYSLYLNNPFIINPGYAGINNMLHAQVAYRTQWIGLEGNPTTINFSAHTSVHNNKAGVGLQILQDRIGENKNTEVQGAFSYKIKFQQSTLSLGMQAGIINYSNNTSELVIRDPGDANFSSYSEFSFNSGAGLMLKSDRYSVGLSAPRLLPATIQQDGTQFRVYQQVLYLTGGYMFILSQDLSFKPTVLIRASKNNPLSTDVQANLAFRHAYTVGLFTRNLNTYGLSACMKYKKFQLGYVFEVPTNRSVGTQYTSHELLIAIRTSIFQFHDEREITGF
jgi:type IX secretion system PorP/SprF family membrane protein